MMSTPSPRVRRRLAALPFAVVAALVVAGCGGSVGFSEGTGDKANGKELFTQKCGSCHILADAGTTGQIGPDLDYAFFASRRDGLGESTITQVVRGQIAYSVVEPSSGSPGMPRDIVTGQDAEDVASYVASVAGVGDPQTPAPAAPAPTPAPSGDGDSSAGDAAAGKDVFASAGCGSCHTLADAGSNGSVGPNLDDTMPAASLVSTRVTKGQGVMPSYEDQLSATQIADVSAYVSSVAGK